MDEKVNKVGKTRELKRKRKIIVKLIKIGVKSGREKSINQVLIKKKNRLLYS